MDQLPQRLTAALADRYRLERQLGQGGMATVYLAEDLKHHRKVAIKVLKPELAALLGTERFLREVETTAGLRHPHILPLYDSGEAEGFLFYVMPLVEGESVRDRLDRERQLPLEDALRIAGEVADALDYAHDRGIVHRRASGNSKDQQMLDGYVMARSGDTAGARRQVRSLEQEDGFAPAAFVLAALGDKDSMYIMFGRAIDARQANVMYYMNAQPVLRPWRHEPRYPALLARMGMPEEWRR